MSRKTTRSFSQVSGMAVLDGLLIACNVHREEGYVTDIRGVIIEGIDPSQPIFWTRNAVQSASLRRWNTGKANRVPFAEIEPLLVKAGDKARNLFDFIVWMTTNGGRDTDENKAKAADLITKAAIAYGVDLSTVATEPVEPEAEAVEEDEEAAEAAA